MSVRDIQCKSVFILCSILRIY